MQENGNLRTISMPFFNIQKQKTTKTVHSQMNGKGITSQLETRFDSED